MENPKNPDLYRFVYTYCQLKNEDLVKEITGGRQSGRYSVTLKEDAKHQDIGRVVGEGFFKAGYVLVGVHQHYTDGNRIDKYTFAEASEIDEEPVPDHVIDNLHYDGERDAFVSIRMEVRENES